MQSVPRVLVDKFSQACAGPKVGFSAREITDYFTQYSNLVKPFDHYGINPTRYQLFIESVYALSPKQQYYALNDLTWREHPSKYQYPDESKRKDLRTQLHCFISPDPIGLSFSRIRKPPFREDWLTCQTRILTNPPAAITAARTMLETILKTIITEREGQPDDSGELGKLIKQAQDAVGFQRRDRQHEHQVLSGLANVINGLSALSNFAGDRHGLVQGQSIDDPSIASLCVNAAGTIALIFIDIHLLTKMNAPTVNQSFVSHGQTCLTTNKNISNGSCLLS